MAESHSQSAQNARPLSPHLQIYRMTLTMMMSIVHRITGAALYFGMALVALVLALMAMGPEGYAWVQWGAGSIIGKLVILGFVWSLYHHALGGIRHFIWDVGAGLDPKGREFWTWFTLIGSITLTALTAAAVCVLK